jgi:hypothetical protein
LLQAGSDGGVEAADALIPELTTQLMRAPETCSVGRVGSGCAQQGHRPSRCRVHWSLTASSKKLSYLR